MKKAYLILFIALSFGCSKTEVNINAAAVKTATITYSFTTTANSKYYASYTDELAHPVNYEYTGTSFSKTVTLSADKGIKKVLFVFGTSQTSPAPNITGVYDVAVNGEHKFNQTVTLTAFQPTISFDVVVFP